MSKLKIPDPGQHIHFPTSRTLACKICGNIQHILPLGSPVLLWELYCVKCLEKFLDEHIGKMKEIE